MRLPEKRRRRPLLIARHHFFFETSRSIWQSSITSASNCFSRSTGNRHRKRGHIGAENEASAVRG